MKRVSALLAGMVAAIALVYGAALAQAQPSKAVGPPDRYIVVLKEDASGPWRAADAMARRFGLGVGFVYGHALKGFSATIPETRLEEVRSDGRVAYVEPDGTAHVTEQALPWGVDRVDADLSSTKAGNGSGKIDNVNAYIIDSGIDLQHPDLNVDVKRHLNFTGDGKNYDCNGHGTHVAGTVAARDNTRAVVGVAPSAPLTGVKVLGCSGSGSYTKIIAGIDWVTAHAVKPAIANVSLEGPFSQALDDAVRNSAANGIFYSIAAGNGAQPACNYSPASAGLAKKDTSGDGIINRNDTNGIVTTAATTDATDAEASFSNYGKCVDIWAPGVGILSTKLGGARKTMSGTSMASPHAGGGAALYLSTHTSASPSSVEAALKAAGRRPGTKSKDGSPILLENVGAF